MEYTQDLFIGIDPGAVAGRSRRSFTYAALDSDCRLAALACGELTDILTFTSNLSRAIVAINGPARLNCGLLSRQPNLLGDLAPKPARMRQVEFDLHTHGLRVPPTPATLEECPHWMIACLHLYQQLSQNGFSSFPTTDSPRQIMETQVEALFSSWTGNSRLLLAGTLEGRIQRQLALLQQRLPVADPMDFFEEITRHKLLRGILPVEKLHSHLELNALAAAALAWNAAYHPETLHPTGEPAEGVIYI